MERGRPFIIGIAGPSGAGKSHLANLLVERLGCERAAALSLDAYYADLGGLPTSERETRNFDEPDAMDWVLFEEHLAILSEGLSIERPIYDFTIHARAEKKVVMPPAEYIVAEGLLTFHSERVRGLLDYKIYVDAPDDLCLERRIDRDKKERGRTRDSVTNQFRRSVAPMAERYVRPSRIYTDVTVSGAMDSQETVETLVAAIKERHAARA